MTSRLNGQRSISGRGKYFLYAIMVGWAVHSTPLLSRYRELSSQLTWCVQVLRSPKEAFAAAMQSWRERCEKCVCLQGDYVEK